ncbi:MAG: SGNH/GDSL hydrolase family protein, partial [Ruminococcaceae bacterium]|nr:SGNH/GDSL hydrolase family protein [Oscillospiraceae bacterium]
MIEKNPLDTLVSDGGFCGIFRTIGCIGDSLSSGELESLTP